VSHQRTRLPYLDPVSMSFVVLFSIILNIFETEQLQIRNWVETRQNCSHRRHGQDKTSLEFRHATCLRSGV